MNNNSPHPEATISGWVARDKLTNSMALYPIKPSRFDGMWNCPGADSVFVIDSDLFPDLTWQDDPIEVEITIKPKKQ